MEEVDAVLQKKILIDFNQVTVTAVADQEAIQILHAEELTICSGEWIHIVGDNGSGKSTFVKLIANQLGMGCHVDGQVRRSSELERPFPYVRQNPEAAIIGTTAWEDLLIGLEQAGVDAEQIQPRIAAALETVRLLDRQHQPVSTMSGGQKQLVAIAGCLAADAPLLILDEAASMLDTASRELVLRAVREQHRRGMTVIWVTHSMEGRQPQDRLIVFDKGRITHDGTIAEDAELHCGRQLTVDAVNVNALSSKTNPEHYLGESQPTGNKRMERDRGPEGALAEGWKLESVSIRRDASHGKPLLNIPRLQIPTGGLTLIAGSNGAGKTTLLETIAGLRRPSAGDISLGGEPLWNGRKLNREVLLKFGLSLQHSESQWFLPQVKDEIVYSLRPYSLGPDDQEARTTSAMELAGLGIDMAARNPWSLSGGQQRRLAWACLLAAQPAWLLLDEPTAGLDAKGTADLLYGLSRHVEQGGSAIVVTHDIGLFRELADRILLVQDGELTASFSAEEWFEDGRIPASNWLLDEQASLKQVQQRREPAGERQNHSSRSPEQSPQPGNQERKGLQWSGYDPRALWLSYVLLAAGILLQHDWQGMIVSGLITIAALWSGKADLRPWFRLIGLYVFMFIFFSFFSGLSMYPSGFDFNAAGKTLFYFCKLLMVMLLGLGMAAAITPFRLQRALEQAIRPLERLRMPVQRIALTLSLIFRFIPLLLSEWSKLSRIVQARGKRASAAGRVPAGDLHRVVLPYIVLLLRMAEQMSEALEARGFGKQGVRVTRAWTLRLEPADYFLTVGAAALLLLLILL